MCRKLLNGFVRKVQCKGQSAFWLVNPVLARRCGKFADLDRPFTDLNCCAFSLFSVNLLHPRNSSCKRPDRVRQVDDSKWNRTSYLLGSKTCWNTQTTRNSRWNHSHHSCTRTHTRTRAHTRIRTRTHARTHTYAHTPFCSNLLIKKKRKKIRFGSALFINRTEKSWIRLQKKNSLFFWMIPWFGFLLGHVNLFSLPQHQHTSFLCPDVSDRIALSFFKELLNKRTKSSRLKTK